MKEWLAHNHTTSKERWANLRTYTFPSAGLVRNKGAPRIAGPRVTEKAPQQPWLEYLQRRGTQPMPLPKVPTRQVWGREKGGGSRKKSLAKG